MTSYTCLFLQLSSVVFCLVILAWGELIPSCQFPPCRFNVYREYEDSGNIAVHDSSVHVISWGWEVKGGRWNVTYHYIYPDGWYEGKVVFINCSNQYQGREQPYVSWGSSRRWQSNAKLIRANAWNISYNGEVFGFVPTRGGRYIFSVYTRNKEHNPFSRSSGKFVEASTRCFLESSKKSQIKEFWKNEDAKYCSEKGFVWLFKGNQGKWRVEYTSNRLSGITSCSVYYANGRSEEYMVIKWNLNGEQNLVSYRAMPIKIFDEPPWSMNLNDDEFWGFSPSGQGNWEFKHFSRNLNFRPV